MSGPCRPCRARRLILRALPSRGRRRIDQRRPRRRGLRACRGRRDRRGRASARHGGGKSANQAVAAARLGAALVVRRCAGGRRRWAPRPSRELEGEGIDVTASRASAAPTGVALIVVDAAGENQIAVASGANAELPAWSRRRSRLAGARRPAAATRPASLLLGHEVSPGRSSLAAARGGGYGRVARRPEPGAGARPSGHDRSPSSRPNASEAALLSGPRRSARRRPANSSRGTGAAVLITLGARARCCSSRRLAGPPPGGRRSTSSTRPARATPSTGRSPPSSRAGRAAADAARFALTAAALSTRERARAAAMPARARGRAPRAAAARPAVRGAPPRAALAPAPVSRCGRAGSSRGGSSCASSSSSCRTGRAARGLRAGRACRTCTRACRTRACGRSVARSTRSTRASPTCTCCSATTSTRARCCSGDLAPERVADELARLRAPLGHDRGDRQPRLAQLRRPDVAGAARPSASRCSRTARRVATLGGRSGSRGSRTCATGGRTSARRCATCRRRAGDRALARSGPVPAASRTGSR